MAYRVAGHRFASTVAKAAAEKEKVVILGSGWAGFKLMRTLDKKKYDVVVVSPRNHFVFTPLLASTAVGSLEFRCITEPIRRVEQLAYYQATCTGIDLAKKEVYCTSSASGADGSSFSLSYDKLVIGVGAYSNTFGIPGVKEHACFLKDVEDARRIRRRLIECFEAASHPGLPLATVRRLLHFAIVGAGPTGIEFSGELHDFCTRDVARSYPSLMPHVSITLYDVAPKILSAFDASLAKYAHQQFDRRGIRIKTRRHVEKVTPHSLHIKDEGEVPYGLLVWSTGLMQNPLVAGMDVAKDTKQQRLLTDDLLRVIDKHGRPMDGVYAVGDAAVIQGANLPATAQVATQQAVYLGQVLNQNKQHASLLSLAPLLPSPFQFKNRGMMTYIGNSEALLDMSSVHAIAKYAGKWAWLFWRSAYLSMSMSVRNRMLIPYYWLLTWRLGRDLTRI
ncbi:FAD/NAD(P)-binding domain-containing protein [Gongronella butleri]|nr:FAD/NAD(P)-binding domain-containing protein [Gongronella butleri]